MKGLLSLYKMTAEAKIPSVRVVNNGGRDPESGCQEHARMQ